MQTTQLPNDQEQGQHKRSLAVEEVLPLLRLPHGSSRDSLNRDRLLEAYADPSHLNARLSIYSYRVPPLDTVDFARDLIDWRGDERVLDVGSGPGRYLEGFRKIHPGLRTVAFDLSEGMARAAGEHGAPCVGSAVALPFEARSFDVTLAMHMLYHAEDIASAVRELKRVTAVGGSVLVATNSATHLRELRALFAEALAASLGKPVPMPRWQDERFDLENGQAVLEQTFSSVRRKAAWGTLRVSDPEPIVAYIESLVLFRHVLPDDQAWEQLLAYVRGRAEQIISEKGSFEIVARAGVFVCRG